MPDAPKTPGASFVVRAWLEPRERGAPQWRFHVSHVQTGEEDYTSELEEVIAFLARRTGVSPAVERRVERTPPAVERGQQP